MERTSSSGTKNPVLNLPGTFRAYQTKGAIKTNQATPSASSPGTPPSPSDNMHEKTAPSHIEQIPTHDRVPGHTNYYEKNGLRTYENPSGAANALTNDPESHNATPRMTFRRLMSLTAMAFLWTGSQIPVYLFGGIPPLIYSDIGGADRWIWFVLANLLSLAAVCPFVGSLSDLLGRRYVAIIGACFIVLGMIVCSTAYTMNVFICGMVFAGVGAGINELTALAVTSELAPTSQRGKYVAVLIFTIVPFCPSVLWAQLIAAYSSWRYVGLLCGVWAFIGLVLTAVFYFPPPRVNSEGLSRREVLGQIDYVGGILSIGGMLLFMAGMQWGGYQYSWGSAHVLAPLILGAAMLIGFCLWETYGATHPMFPKRLRQDPRILGLTLVITFISGANFFSILMFWPTQAFNMYGHSPVGVGIRGLPVGFSILVGACLVLYLLSVFRGHNRELLIFSSILMTAGCGSLAIARIDNLHQLWGLLVLAGLGIGGIVVPASIITTIICPDDLIATIAALTLAIRVIGGSIGYCVYYNVFINKFVPAATYYIGGTMTEKLNITSEELIGKAIEITGASLLPALKEIPGIGDVPGAYEMVVVAGQMAYAEAYKWVYYVSIAFGCLMKLT
ncbi:MFS multidrug transporter-like protein [Hortaea werneckii]|nr:MFS multidrug transporter-like protein [Hortaea werneckii]KAI7097097.1 MFS multidrug transporter-like protein [Hortaea werneckii]KAI7212135.1 MFS multidrug transporter-like protein [Hortaea werneckii]KAI7320315.1 MFS multidrug transporter-like protein [Hortaea werneckii]KAI7464532.1 MFS multidrug transporter-like protein [Hortaea werneckii]